MTLTSGFSLVVALSVALAMEGRSSLRRLFDWRGILRFGAIAFLMSAAIPCHLGAFWSGTSPSDVYTLGMLYLPVAVVTSLLVIKRTYGILEILSLTIITLTTVIFMHLRATRTEGNSTTLTLQSASLLVCSCIFNVVSSTFAERIYKGKTIRNGQVLKTEPESFYILKGRLDCACLFFSGAGWAVQVMLHHVSSSSIGCGDALQLPWTLALRSAAIIVLGWLSGLMAKYFTTVFRCIIEVFAYVALMLCVDPILGEHRFTDGEIGAVAFFLVLMIFISALIFQTGRLNIAFLIEQMDLSDRIHPASFAEASFDAIEVQPGSATRLQMFNTHRCNSLWRVAMRSSSIIVFVLLDAGRQISQAKVLGKLMLTPQTFMVVTFLVGVIVASATTLWASESFSTGLGALKKAYHPQILWRYLPCGVLFGLSGVLTALAFSAGIDAGLNTALGYIYTPFAALASSFVLQKYYMWLEWFALAILSCALVVFGLLSTIYSGNTGGSSSLAGICCVVGSALVSVLASLVSEKLLKQEDRPFHQQKIALDMGSAFLSLLMLPMIGLIEADPKYSFWKDRPLDQACMIDICWQTGAQEGCGSPACTCECGSGFFVAWDSWLIPLTLVINVAQGWMTGAIIKQFSTVIRALAQSFTLLVIYFIGDPIFATGAAHTVCLTLVTFTIPLSNMIFVNAMSEMEKVMDVRSRLPTAHSIEASRDEGLCESLGQ